MIETGCARVDGDEEEDGIDDLENEFNFDASRRNDLPQQHPLSPEPFLYFDNSDPLHPIPQLPLLTDGQTVPSLFLCVSIFSFISTSLPLRCFMSTQVDDIPPDQHALVPSFMSNGAAGGKRIHPLPFSDPGNSSNSHCVYFSRFLLSVLHLFQHFVVQPRSMDPSKDLGAYGYGSIAWKERMENWKQKHERLQMMSENGGNGGDNDNDALDLPL